MLAIAETIKFLGLHLDNPPIVEVSHKCIIKEDELCMFYDEKIILLVKHRYTKNSLLYTLPITDTIWYNFFGPINNHAQCTFNTKQYHKNHAGIRSYLLYRWV
jgi:hypothetical protein